ncbi:MAG: hypothetical protein ACOYID_01815 [Eubacteriales bacterium]|jgi:hypothetical protein
MSFHKVAVKQKTLAVQSCRAASVYKTKKAERNITLCHGAGDRT